MPFLIGNTVSGQQWEVVDELATMGYPYASQVGMAVYST
jgi:hypothetical protein